MRIRVRKALRITTGVLLCAAVAVLVAPLFAGHEWRVFVPLAFVLVLFAAAWRYGVAVSLLGSLLAALIFAYFMYPPLGSLSVANRDARVNLAWMLLLATALSYLLLGPSNPRPRKR